MLVIIIFAVILFILLIPGFLLRIPKKGSFLTVSIVHSIIFAILFYVIYRIYSRYNNTEKFATYTYSSEIIPYIPEKYKDISIEDGNGNKLPYNRKVDNYNNPFVGYKYRYNVKTGEINKYIPVYRVVTETKQCKNFTYKSISGRTTTATKCTKTEPYYTTTPPQNCKYYRDNICYK